jgi:S-formylglutathione hydrolase FrmB
MGRIAVLALLATLALAGEGQAATLETWTTTSAFVDPAKVHFNGAPPGGPKLAPALRVDVLLPDGYDPSKAYPVLYLLHGHGDRFDSWVNPQAGDVEHVAAGFPGVIVMPEAGTGWYTNWWNGGRRGAPAWERYHLDELIPLVESRLKILPGRQNHAIAGLSMGGEGAMYYAEQRPGYFGSVASFSGVLSIQRPEWPTGFDTQGEKYLDVFGDPDAQRFYWTGHNPTALVSNLRHTRVFVRVGDGVPDPTSQSEVNNWFGAISELDLRQHAEDFVAAARGAGVAVRYEPTQGIHAWRYWRAALASAIRWGFFRPVDDAPASWTYSTVSETGKAWDVRYSFAKPPAAVETFTRSGNTLSATGSGQVTIRAAGRPAFTATVPFTRALPPRASHRRRRHHVARHHSRR